MQTRLKMMNFKTLIVTIFFFVASDLYADASKNKTEKDAKVGLGVTILLAELQTNDIAKQRINGVKKNTVKNWHLNAEQWELARSGESMLAAPILNKVAVSWLKNRDKVIEIQYPGGEEGEFWVQELMDWLVALGIPTEKMLSTPGSGADDVIKLSLVN